MLTTSESASSDPTLVIGIGNRYRSDDGIGPIVAERVRARLPTFPCIIEERGEGAALLELWEDVHTVVLIDAVSSGAEPGTIHRFDATANPLPVELFSYSSHAFGVAGAVELARILHRLPPRLLVYGIEGRDFSAGDTLSGAVIHALEPIVEQIVNELLSLQEHEV